MLVGLTFVYWMLVYQPLMYIENLCPELQPETIMTYFELATLNGAESEFPRSSLVYGHKIEE